MNVLVLLSGGIDSATCISYYQSRKYKVSALFVNYSQPSAEFERAAALAIADYYSIQLKQLTLIGCDIAEGYIAARNMMLLSLALMNFDHHSGIIALGIHASTPYADCSPEFTQAMQQIYDLYKLGCVCIDAPFLHWTKREIWDYALSQNVPLYLTHSNNLDSLGLTTTTP